MKSKILTLNIEKPCGENWNSLSPVAGGRFCSSCSKIVIDFTKASDAEILQFIQQKPAHACGRFRASQLKTYSEMPFSNVRPGLMVMKAALLSLLLLLISKPGTAQSKQSKTSVEMAQATDHASGIKDSTDYWVKGIVRAKEDGCALPGVSVILKGSVVGTQTDENGKFEFPQPLQAGDVLYFSFIGLMTKEVRIRNHEQLKLELEMDMMTTLGEIAIAEPYTPKESLFKRTWSRVKQLF